MRWAWFVAWLVLVLTVAFAVEARRRAAESRVPWPVTLVPVIGAAAWLAGGR